LGQLYYLDKEIGKVTNYLKENGLEENTIVILISDNGGSTPIYADNTPLKGSKYTLYEGGIRVPLLISYPVKYQKGKVSNNMISAMDVLPTLCTAVGIESPTNIDGMDITQLLTGENESIEHESLIWDNNAQTAVRKGKWKLRTASDKAKSNSEYEMVEMEYGDYLYDLKKDIGETPNLASEYPEILKELKNIHTTWRTNLNSK
jgi:arylsulfatase A-like enzyme